MIIIGVDFHPEFQRRCYERQRSEAGFPVSGLRQKDADIVPRF